MASEDDGCGVDGVGDLNNVPSDRMVGMGRTGLRGMMQRGAAGGDPDTGDGAGLVLALPDEFFRAELGGKLPEPGKYGVAMIFGGAGREAAGAEGVTAAGGRGRAGTARRKGPGAAWG